MFKFIILTNLLLLLWGNALLRLLWPQGRRLIWIYVPVSYYLGECCVVLWMYFLAIFRIHFSILSIDLPISMMALLSYFVRGHSFMPERFDPPGNKKWGMLKASLVVIAVMYITFQVLFVIWMTVTIPVFEWDVVWRIGLKARVFFVDHGIENLKNLPYFWYALGGPFILCWTSLQGGIWSEVGLRSVPAFEFLMFVILFFGFLSVLLSRFWAILGVGLLVSSAFFTYHATLLYNDFSVSILFCSSLFCLILWNKFKDNRILLVASLLLGGSGLFKLESFLYAFLIVMSWKFLFVSKSRLKTATIFSIPVIAAFICHEMLCWRLHPNPSETNVGFLGTAGLSDRVIMTAVTFGKQLFAGWNWNILWGLLFVLLITNLKRIRDHEELRLLMSFLGLLVGYLFLTSIFTDKYRLLGGVDSYQTLPRMILHFYPLCPAAIVFLLAY
jgi:hypothetical protein